ncbi:MAG: PQQ-dependent sugar dehydrogenase [Chitinophagaceae bacterium]
MSTTRNFYKSCFFITVMFFVVTNLKAQNEPFTMKVLANRFSFPYEVIYGPDNNLWLTERTAGRVTTVNPANGAKTTVLTLGNKMVQSAGQDGLMGLALHPLFLSTKPYVYIAYTYRSIDATHRLTRIERYTYTIVRNKPTLGSPVTVIENLPGSNDHNSGRLAIGPDNKLYYSIGDMGAGQFDNLSRPNNAQNLDIYEGKILRLNLELSNGSWIPADNPFTDGNGNRTAVYTLGHRNAQGLVWGNVNGTDKLYSCEHGPFSDDEVNLVEAGRNYGWPRVGGYCDGNYNARYLGGQWVGVEQDNCIALNVKEPLTTMYSPANPPDSTTSNLTWPSVAPSGMGFYNSPAIPGWRNSLLLAGLKSGTLIRFKLSEDGLTIVGDTIMYFRGKGRFRDVCVSPDGRKIYISTDNSGSTSGPTGGVLSTPPNPGAILEFTYTGTIGARPSSDPLITEEPVSGILIYPNPANDLITIRAERNDAMYSLVSVTGVSTKRYGRLEYNQQLFVGDLPSGVYILRIVSSKGELLAVKKINIIH